MSPPAFGSYRVLHQIGSGVLGPVFRGYDADRDRLVAIKTLRLDLLPEDAVRLGERLRALATAGSPHAAVATIVDAGTVGATPFLAVEFLAGETLDVTLRESGALAPARALPILRTIAEAIDAASQQGLDHGSLHPRDVFVAGDPKDVRITGFGIARALEDVGAKPPVRLPYSAPERSGGGTWDKRADVYSLAMLAREVLGEVANTDVEVKRVLAAATNERPPSRPASAVDLISALESALAPKAVPEVLRLPRVAMPAQAPVIEYDRPMILKTDRAGASFPWAATAAVLVAGLVIGGAVGYQIGWSRAVEAPAAVVAVPAPVATSTSVDVVLPAATPEPTPVASATPPEPSPEPKPAARASRPAATTARRVPVTNAPAPTTGSLVIESRPRDARVFIDGKPFGTTPLKVPELSVGKHQVRFEKDGHKSVTSTVNIVGGQATPLRVTLELSALAMPAGLSASELRERAARTEWGVGAPASERVGGTAGAKPPGKY